MIQGKAGSYLSGSAAAEAAHLQGNIPLSDLKTAAEKRQQKLLLSHLLSLFHEISQLPPEVIILCGLGFFFLKKPKQSRCHSACWISPGGSHPAFPQELGIPKGKPGSQPAVAEQSWEASWRGAGAQKLHFFGSDPLPKVIKVHKELSAQIFNKRNLAFLHRGTRGKGSN